MHRRLAEYYVGCCFSSAEGTIRKSSSKFCTAAVVGQVLEAGSLPTSVQEALDIAPIPFTTTELMRSAQCPPHERWRHGRWTQWQAALRIARNVKHFERLPPELRRTDAFQDMEVSAIRWFDTIVNLPPVSRENHSHFVRYMSSISRKEKPILPLISSAILGAKGANIDPFLHDFCTCRISWRLLLNHHWVVRSSSGTGVINPFCDPLHLAEAALGQVRDLCCDHYGIRPVSSIQRNTERTIEHVDANVQYILMELIKNAMKATIDSDNKEMPVIVEMNDTVLEDQHAINVRIIDQGRGISEGMKQTIWKYGWSTVSMSATELQSVQNRDEEVFRAPRIAGWGCGLPLAKCYAEHFGGTLELFSGEGEGCEARLTLPVIGKERAIV